MLWKGFLLAPDLGDCFQGLTLVPPRFGAGANSKGQHYVSSYVFGPSRTSMESKVQSCTLRGVVPTELLFFAFCCPFQSKWFGPFGGIRAATFYILVICEYLHVICFIFPQCWLAQKVCSALTGVTA